MVQKSIPFHTLLILSIGWGMIGCLKRHTSESRGIVPAPPPQPPARQFLWDNGSYMVQTGPMKARQRLSWSLVAAPPVGADPEVRHQMAKIQISTSKAEGKPHHSTPQVIGTIENPKGGAIWSGSLIECEKDLCKIEEDLRSRSEVHKWGKINLKPVGIENRIGMLFTLPEFVDPSKNDIPQKIMLGFTGQNGDFQVYDKPLLDPSELNADQLGYQVAREGSIVQAWRDPFFYKNQDFSDDFHIFFAAKYNREFAKQHGLAYDINRNSAIGHAILLDGKWQAAPPLVLGETAAQFELPHVVRVGDDIYLFVLEADWNTSDKGQMTTKRQEGIRLYKWGGSRNDRAFAGKEPWLPWGERNQDGVRTSRLVSFEKSRNVYGVTYSYDSMKDQLLVHGFINDAFTKMEPLKIEQVTQLIQDPDQLSRTMKAGFSKAQKETLAQFCSKWLGR